MRHGAKVEFSEVSLQLNFGNEGKTRNGILCTLSGGVEVRHRKRFLLKGLQNRESRVELR
jgi:hypothetical protein